MVLLNDKNEREELLVREVSGVLKKEKIEIIKLLKNNLFEIKGEIIECSVNFDELVNKLPTTQMRNMDKIYNSYTPQGGPMKSDTIDNPDKAKSIVDTFKEYMYPYEVSQVDPLYSGHIVLIIKKDGKIIGKIILTSGIYHFFEENKNVGNHPPKISDSDIYKVGKYIRDNY